MRSEYALKSNPLAVALWNRLIVIRESKRQQSHGAPCTKRFFVVLPADSGLLRMTHESSGFRMDADYSGATQALEL